ncbi:probable glucan endo-1 3-beta-glucosidase a6 [Phtheirospermum japonicum]|uniref:Probable glucan endo-1 3-beta-glucosidase a6 n=1 Tax=Phtheirospermum japonicum TaxID=374723 RepID=A0A830B2C4_9LAMI|nr:probable glucan endo-1 3-beta-glucosidase a6 [Phtheirospermum japonicum]
MLPCSQPPATSKIAAVATTHNHHHSPTTTTNHSRRLSNHHRSSTTTTNHSRRKPPPPPPTIPKLRHLQNLRRRRQPLIVDPASGLVYNNLLDQMVDSVVFAMRRLEFEDVRVPIAETGWPLAGDIDQLGDNAYNAVTYIRNLVTKMTAYPPIGTPARPGVEIPTFVISLFDKNQNSCPGTERYWGLLDNMGRPIYENILIWPSESGNMDNILITSPVKLLGEVVENAEREALDLDSNLVNANEGIVAVMDVVERESQDPSVKAEDEVKLSGEVVEIAQHEVPPSRRCFCAEVELLQL